MPTTSPRVAVWSWKAAPCSAARCSGGRSARRQPAPDVCDRATMMPTRAKVAARVVLDKRRLARRLAALALDQRETGLKGGLLDAVRPRRKQGATRRTSDSQLSFRSRRRFFSNLVSLAVWKVQRPWSRSRQRPSADLGAKKSPPLPARGVRKRRTRGARGRDARGFITFASKSHTNDLWAGGRTTERVRLRTCPEMDIQSLVPSCRSRSRRRCSLGCSQRRYEVGAR